MEDDVKALEEMYPQGEKVINIRGERTVSIHKKKRTERKKIK